MWRKLAHISISRGADLAVDGLLASHFYLKSGFLLMQGEEKERWMQLCAQAAVEQDPAKLTELVRER